jgi:XRE family transcriptional regulator, regulator of sulfur utilization
LKEFRRLLGRRLRALRKSRRWSQEELAERAELTGKFIGEVERGDKGITLDNLYSISKALGVPLREVVDIIPGKEQHSLPELDEALSLLRQQTRPREIRRVVRVVRALLEGP